MKKIICIVAATTIVLALFTGCRDDKQDSYSEGDVQPDSSSSTSYAPDSDSSSESALPETSSQTATAMSDDWSSVDSLPSKAFDWGPGGPVDELGRSQSAVAYNDKYGKYNASFIGSNEPVVYLTFDEGYEYGLTGSILDTLRDKQVKAMFFVTYDFANRSGDLVQRMIDEGHVVGNHSYSHKNYSTLSPKQAADDLMKMHEFVRQKFDYEMLYFRFPSGNYSEQSLAAVNKMGYRTLFWSFAYKDWIVDEQPDPDSSLTKMVAAACPGNIYLLHAVSSTNDKILGEAIDRIRDAGYCWGDPSTL